MLPNGHTVLVNTFTCGLYRVDGLAASDASVHWIYSTPFHETERKRFCAVPAVAGRFWIQTSGYEHAVITLDVSDPARPREAGRLALAADDVPHWIAIEPSGRRIVITGYEGLESRVLIADLDRETGALRLDTSFTTRGASKPGVDFGRERWPHGATGAAIPHGAVFGNR